MSPESVSEVEPQPSGMSELSRLTGVFFEPKKAFEDIAARPRWIVPMILTILAGLAFSIAMGARIGWDRVVQQQMEARLEKMTPDQRAAAEPGMELQRKITPIAAYGFSVIGPAIGYTVAAAILLAIVSGIMSVPVKFKQIFAIMCYAGMPGLIFSVLAIVVMFLKSNPADFNLRNPLAFNAGAFMDPQTSSKFIYSLASSIDLFALWRIYLVATGLKAAGGKKLSVGGAFMAVALPWAILVLIGAGFAGVFG
jgi:Yip1 domain